MHNHSHPRDAAANSNSLHSVVAVDRSIPQLLYHEFITKSFFLPKEILQSSSYIVEKIQVISGEHWQDSKGTLEAMGATVAYDPNSEAIINAAKFVGVSVRKHTGTHKLYIVVKLWYGENSQQMFVPKQKAGN